MPVTTVRGVEMNYEVLGERGPWVALQPGGRRALAGVKSLGRKLAEAGCRVLVYDRRNCGRSGGAFQRGKFEKRALGRGPPGFAVTARRSPGLHWRQFVRLPPGAVDSTALSRRCARPVAVAGDWRRVCGPAPH